MDTDDKYGSSRFFKESLTFPDCILVNSRSGTKSEPNSRSGSFKRNVRIKQLLDEEKRRNSLPVSTEKALSSSYNDISDYRRRPKRVRSFKTNSKGIATATRRDRRESNVSVKSLKDLIRTRLSSETSEDSAICCGCSSTCSSGYFRICIMGADSVGKRTLINQFMSSELMCSNVFELGELDENVLSVVIDNEDSTLEFVDFTEHIDDRFPMDAYIVVFSVHERATFDVAIRYLQYARNEQYSDRPIIIVANKVDLVRKRQVTNNEAKEAATKFNCKYIETSATLNHKVDDLLVGILKQIKLKLDPEMTEHNSSTTKDVCLKGPKGFLSRLFHQKSKSKSCDDFEAL